MASVYKYIGYEIYRFSITDHCRSEYINVRRELCIILSEKYVLERYFENCIRNLSV